MVPSGNEALASFVKLFNKLLNVLLINLKLCGSTSEGHTLMSPLGKSLKMDEKTLNRVYKKNNK